MPWSSATLTPTRQYTVARSACVTVFVLRITYLSSSTTTIYSAWANLSITVCSTILPRILITSFTFLIYSNDLMSYPLIVKRCELCGFNPIQNNYNIIIIIIIIKYAYTLPHFCGHCASSVPGFVNNKANLTCTSWPLSSGVEWADIFRR